MKKVHIASWDHETLMDMKVDDHQIEVLEALQSAGILEFEIVKNEQIEKLLKSTSKTFTSNSEKQLIMAAIESANKIEKSRRATNRDLLICILQMLERAGYIALMDKEYGGLKIDQAIKELQEEKE